MEATAKDFAFIKPVSTITREQINKLFITRGHPIFAMEQQTEILDDQKFNSYPGYGVAVDDSDATFLAEQIKSQDAAIQLLTEEIEQSKKEMEKRKSKKKNPTRDALDQKKLESLDQQLIKAQINKLLLDHSQLKEDAQRKTQENNIMKQEYNIMKQELGLIKQTLMNIEAGNWWNDSLIFYNFAVNVQNFTNSSVFRSQGFILELAQIEFNENRASRPWCDAITLWLASQPDWGNITLADFLGCDAALRKRRNATAHDVSGKEIVIQLAFQAQGASKMIKEMFLGYFGQTLDEAYDEVLRQRSQGNNNINNNNNSNNEQ